MKNGFPSDARASPRNAIIPLAFLDRSCICVLAGTMPSFHSSLTVCLQKAISIIFQ